MTDSHAATATASPSLSLSLTPSQMCEKIINYVKYIGSGALLGFCIAIVMTGNQTGRAITGPGGLILFWIFIVYLACIEGGQNALVGLQPINPDSYQTTHHLTSYATRLTRQDGYLEKFVMGRQLITVIVVFAINSVGSISTECSTQFYLPSILSAIFCSSGLALIFVTILLGQVTAQIISTTCMLDFINNYLFLVTTYLSVGIEFSGILHAVHFVSQIFEIFSGEKKEEKKEREGGGDIVESILYWGRVAVSFLFLGFSLGCIIQEILLTHTKMWSGVPPAASIAIFFSLLCCVGLLEGMQIALFACVNMNITSSSTPQDTCPSETDIEPKIQRSSVPESERSRGHNLSSPSSASSPSALAKRYPLAVANCELVFSGKNLKSFVVGRQICVTVIMFVVARICSIDTSLSAFTDENYTTFSVSSSFQSFINTGIIAAFVTTILGSLIFRVIASKSPLLFLSLPLIYPLICLCLALESTGIIQFAKAVAKCFIYLFRYQSDEIHKRNMPKEIRTEEIDL